MSGLCRCESLQKSLDAVIFIKMYFRLSRHEAKFGSINHCCKKQVRSLPVGTGQDALLRSGCRVWLAVQVGLARRPACRPYQKDDRVPLLPAVVGYFFTPTPPHTPPLHQSCDPCKK
jgi:hypothetical protein